MEENNIVIEFKPFVVDATLKSNNKNKITLSNKRLEFDLKLSFECEELVEDELLNKSVKVLESYKLDDYGFIEKSSIKQMVVSRMEYVKEEGKLFYWNLCIMDCYGEVMLKFSFEKRVEALDVYNKIYEWYKS